MGQTDSTQLPVLCIVLMSSDCKGFQWFFYSSKQATNFSPVATYPDNYIHLVLKSVEEILNFI